MSLTIIFTFFILFILPFTSAHGASWTHAMYGRCGSNNQCRDTSEPATPLRSLNFSQWWFHNYLDLPPPKDTFVELPAGKDAVLEIACNVAQSSLGEKGEGVYWPGGARKGEKDESVVNNHKYWSDGTVGNLHTTGKNDTHGCALSIAYTDDAKKVRPEDFVVFSVQHICVWHRDTPFGVPANMPPCPPGGCICSWWWIHSSAGGSDQMYQTGFKCNVTYAPGQAISTTPIGRPVPPVNCENDLSKCIKGPKLPMYWKQNECNNMYEPGHKAPAYRRRYGFEQGAQNDIFQTLHSTNWTCPQSKAVGVSKRSIPLRHRQAKRRTIQG